MRILNLVRFILFFSFFFSLVEVVAELPSLLIKIPTRDRFNSFFKALDQYYLHLSQEVPYLFVISCDIDDPVMNSPEARKKLSTYPNLVFYFGPNKNKIQACNADIDKHLDYDIILLGSDDMIPITKEYDKIIVKNMQQAFPNFDGVLHHNDGHAGASLLTLPIMGINFYQKFNYIYYPEYQGFFCDNELHYVSWMLNKSKYFDQVLIEHRNPFWGNAETDDLYIRNSKYGGVDAILYKKREAMHFGLTDEEIINHRILKKLKCHKKLNISLEKTMF